MDIIFLLLHLLKKAVFLFKGHLLLASKLNLLNQQFIKKFIYHISTFFYEHKKDIKLI